MEYADALCTAHESRPVAPVNPDGSIDSDRLNEVKRYYEVLARARAALASPEEAPSCTEGIECNVRQGP